MNPKAIFGNKFRSKPRGIMPAFSSAEAEREGGLKNHFYYNNYEINVKTYVKK